MSDIPHETSGQYSTVKDEYIVLKQDETDGEHGAIGLTGVAELPDKASAVECKPRRGACAVDVLLFSWRDSVMCAAMARFQEHGIDCADLRLFGADVPAVLDRTEHRDGGSCPVLRQGARAQHHLPLGYRLPGLRATGTRWGATRAGRSSRSNATRHSA